MASRGLGTLTLDLIAKIGGFVGPMSQAERAAAKSMSNIERRANAFGRAIGSSLRSVAGQFLAFAGVSVTVGAAFEGLKKAIDLADETRDLSIQLGTSTETISEFRYAAQQTGTDMDVLAKGMKILAKNAADALNPTSQQAKVFEALGIKVTDAAGNLKQLDQLIPEVADKFKGLEDGTTKAALAQQLFGKSGLELTEFLNQGSDGLKTMADRARELGIVIDSKTANAADKFNDTLSDLKAATGGLATKVAADLLPQITQLAQWAVDFVRDGANSANIAHEIADGFRDMADGLNAIGKFVGFLGQIRDLLGSIEGFNIDLAKKIGADRFSNFLKDQFPSLYKPIIGGHADFSNVKGGGPDFSNVTGTSDTVGAGGVDTKRLNQALGGVSGSHSHGGKSDAERQAEQVARAIEQMTKAQQDWESELSKTGNPIADEYAARLRDIAEQGKQFAKDGVPADKIKAFTDQMTTLAQQMRDADIAKFQKDFNDETAAMAAQLQGPTATALQQYQVQVRDLDEQLKAGTITLDEYNDRLKQLGVQRDAPWKSVLQDIEEQTNALGLNSEQQDTYNKLKQAGVSANSDMGKAIIAANEDLYQQARQMSDQITVMDGLRDSARGFLDEIAHGVSPFKALKDAASNFLDTLIEVFERKWVLQIFGEDGSAGYGSGGGNFLSGLLSSFFSSFGNSGFGGQGSPLAAGGPVNPMKFHEVGEFDRPELLYAKGKQYLIPGNQGRVVPIGAGSGSTVNQTNNFILPSRIDNRTQMQIAQAAGYSSRDAMRKNGGRK